MVSLGESERVAFPSGPPSRYEVMARISKCGAARVSVAIGCS